MARARNIKPSFFTNEELVELPFEVRLLFIGLWTLADREGRLEDRPKRIKMAIFPADDVDVDAALDMLQRSGFVARYQAHGIAVVQVLNFTKHQNPHVKEAASELPKAGEPGACTVLASCESGASHADSLNPPSLNPELPNADALGVASPQAADLCPHQQIIEAYHELLPNCTPVRVWNDQRKALLRQRWREDAKRQRIEWWRKFFAYVAGSEFLTGRGQTTPGRDPFVADLEWLVRPQNFAKVVEGKYHRQEDAA